MRGRREIESAESDTKVPCVDTHLGVISGENSQAEKGASARSGVAAAACGRAALERARERAGSGSEGGRDRAVHLAVIVENLGKHEGSNHTHRTRSQSTEHNQTNQSDETQK